MAIFRVTGKAGLIEERKGTTGEGENKRAWTMRSQTIEIAPLVGTSVSLPDGADGYPVGQAVDLAVDVEAKGGYLRTAIKGDWPSPVPAHVRAAS